MENLVTLTKEKKKKIKIKTFDIIKLKLICLMSQPFTLNFSRKDKIKDNYN